MSLFQLCEWVSKFFESTTANISNTHLNCHHIFLINLKVNEQLWPPATTHTNRTDETDHCRIAACELNAFHFSWKSDPTICPFCEKVLLQKCFDMVDCVLKYIFLSMFISLELNLYCQLTIFSSKLKVRNINTSNNGSYNNSISYAPSS